MSPETSSTSEVRDEPSAPADTGAPVVHTAPRAIHSAYSLAALLELNDEELAQPLSRAGPAEHRWEQLTLGVAPDTGDAQATTFRSAWASYSR